MNCSLRQSPQSPADVGWPVQLFQDGDEPVSVCPQTGSLWRTVELQQQCGRATAEGTSPPLQDLSSVTPADISGAAAPKTQQNSLSALRACVKADAQSCLETRELIHDIDQCVSHRPR